jgi:thiol-disulfide isomerase/thioredoxin
MEIQSMKRLTLFTLCSLLIITGEISGAAKKAPGFALLNNKGKYISRSKYKGSLIISFWASYCKPCRHEMPEILKLYKKYEKSKNLHLVLINVDTNKGKSAKEKADSFLSEIGVEHDYLLDIYQVVIKQYMKASNRKSQKAELNVPSTFVVNKRGYFVLKTVGYKKDTLSKLENAVKNLR